MIKKLLVYVLVFVFAVSVVYAVPGSWYGYVTYDAATAADGVVIDAYISSAVAGTAAVGAVQSNGYYLIHVEGNLGDLVWFKVYGNNVTQAAQVWAAGFNHPQFNLTATSTANGQTCPTYTGYTAGTGVANLGCAGGFCVHTVCRAAATFCGDGFCDAGESCTADCGGGGGGSTGGGSSGGAETVACTENWECTAWSPDICPASNMQTRACSDSNNCGTTENKPEESQFCVYVPAEAPPAEVIETLPPAEEIPPSGEIPIKEPAVPLGTGIIVLIASLIAAAVLLFLLLIREKKKHKK